MDNGLISYYDTPCTSSVRQLRLRVVPVKFIQVMMLACQVYPLSGHIHDQRTLFIILACFWWPMFNKDVAQLIRSFAHCQLVNSCSHEAKQLLQNIDSGTPFDMLFLYFWGPEDIPDWGLSCKILTCPDFMTRFGVGEAIGLNGITSDKAVRWYFGNFFVQFGL